MVLPSGDFGLNAGLSLRTTAPCPCRPRASVTKPHRHGEIHLNPAHHRQVARCIKQFSAPSVHANEIYEDARWFPEPWKTLSAGHLFTLASREPSAILTLAPGFWPRADFREPLCLLAPHTIKSRCRAAWTSRRWWTSFTAQIGRASCRERV